MTVNCFSLILYESGISKGLFHFRSPNLSWLPNPISLPIHNLSYIGQQLVILINRYDWLFTSFWWLLDCASNVDVWSYRLTNLFLSKSSKSSFRSHLFVIYLTAFWLLFYPKWQPQMSLSTQVKLKWLWAKNPYLIVPTKTPA